MAQLALDRSFRIAQRRSSYPADWFIEDDAPVPQSIDHQNNEYRLQSILLAWKARTGRDDVTVGCELAFRWDVEEPRVGIDPDVYIAETPPRNKWGDVSSVCTWKERNVPPLLAIEIVSDRRPAKDYSRSPERHDLLGTYELWVFDPELRGYTKEQPPVLFQLFQRETNNYLVQTYAGAGPVFSDALQAWVRIVDRELVISNDREGKDRWLTGEEEQAQRADAEAQRADAEAKRADAEAQRADAEAKRANEEAKRAADALKLADLERQEKEKALARLAEFEALLAKRQ
ncbi:MAG TPA: Uma2 family endonuclease [Polyangium sp.]|nr:Uma2 family endonuclease [Polyangium sp.]